VTLSIRQNIFGQHNKVNLLSKHWSTCTWQQWLKCRRT